VPVRRRPEPDAGSSAPAAAVAVAGQRPSSVFDEPEVDLDVPLPIEPDDTDDGRAARNRALIEWIAVIVGAIAVAFLVKTFLIQAFYIPSSSMEPTLQINDRVLVNKLSYDFGDVNRGDLVVFERPENLVSNTDDLIKRVIGLPGETIELIDGRVFVTGRGLSEPYVGDEPTNWLGFDETARELCGGDDICTIPDGHYFVMGDNRTGSTDSRRFGPIEEGAIVGRAFLRIWPLNDIGWL
jgi:signal peptidase I